MTKHLSITGGAGFIGSHIAGEALIERLVLARRHVPFVQADLIESASDDSLAVDAWRARLLASGVWANDPVPLFPYPGSPDYRKLWGLPDDNAWERALDHYLAQFDGFSDLQEQRPLRLPDLERGLDGGSPCGFDCGPGRGAHPGPVSHPDPSHLPAEAEKACR